MQTIGYLYEQDAVDLIENQGLEVLCRNFRRKTGEIDIIALDGEHLVFIEVRSRSNRRFASAIASVDRGKQQRILRTAQLFLQYNTQWARRPCRFDVIGFEPAQQQKKPSPTWIRGAFTG